MLSVFPKALYADALPELAATCAALRKVRSDQRRGDPVAKQSQSKHEERS